MNTHEEAERLEQAVRHALEGTQHEHEIGRVVILIETGKEYHVGNHRYDALVLFDLGNDLEGYEVARDEVLWTNKRVQQVGSERVYVEDQG